jgi:hypothetical protein
VSAALPSHQFERGVALPCLVLWRGVHIAVAARVGGGLCMFQELGGIGWVGDRAVKHGRGAELDSSMLMRRCIG